MYLKIVKSINYCNYSLISLNIMASSEVAEKGNETFWYWFKTVCDLRGLPENCTCSNIKYILMLQMLCEASRITGKLNAALT